MKHLLSVVAVLFCFLGASIETKACSPVVPRLEDIVKDYNEGRLIIVEGYYIPSKERVYTSRFIVTRSSDTKIQVGKEYDVYEYGPFGDTCEEYEMSGGIDNRETGENHRRILFLYKGRSKDGRLVTPIFWDGGLEIENDRMIKKEYGYFSDSHKEIVYSIFYNDFWTQAISKKIDINNDVWRKELVKY